MNKFHYLMVVIMAFVILAAPAWGGEVSVRPDGSTTWQAGIDGVVIEWAPDGSLNAVSSTDIEPVAFPDREGIYKAKVIAEEKAKAAIVRFMNQTVATTRVVSDIDNDLSKSTRERQSGAGDNVKRVDSRTLISSLAEMTTSFAQGTLPGVIILADHYSPKSEEYSVTVGYSRKTMRAAKELKQLTTKPSSSGASSDDWLHQPETDRTYPNSNWK